MTYTFLSRLLTGMKTTRDQHHSERHSNKFRTSIRTTSYQRLSSPQNQTQLTTTTMSEHRCKTCDLPYSQCCCGTRTYGSGMCRSEGMSAASDYDGLCKTCLNPLPQCCCGTRRSAKVERGGDDNYCRTCYLPYERCCCGTRRAHDVVSMYL